ncbi:hypothetical protein DO97_17755, partial [Neosynechococcus sphagnicola sy1]
NDRFIFDTGVPFDSSTIGIDTITDFASGQDYLVLDRTTFTQLGTTVSFAAVGTEADAATSAALITYITATGSLYYNQNGSNTGFGLGGQFADLSDGLGLTTTDFSINP